MGGCLSGIMYASDLKIVLRIWDGLRIDQPGGDHVRWRNAIFSDNGLSAMGYVSSHRQTIPRRLSGSQIPVFRAIESDGICPDDVSGKPPRYRSMPDIPNTEAVPHGDIRHRQSLNLGRRKRNARLADICRSCTTVDCAGTATICWGGLGYRSEQHRLYVGFHDHRSVSVDISVGTFSHNQSCSQNAYAFRHQRRNTKLHPYLRRQAARRQRHGHANSGARCLLSHGSWISGFSASLHIASDWQFFCNSIKVKPRWQKNIFGPYREDNRGDMRSVDFSEWSLQQSSVSRTIAAHSVQSARNGQNTGVSEQSKNTACFDHMRFVQKPMGGRAVLSVDQAKPSHQELLWNIGECGKDANLDCRFGIRADSNHQKALGPRV